MHHSSILSQPAVVRDWRPEFPAGSLCSVVLHWTAGDYETVFPAYHLCLAGAADVVVHQTHDLRANMRDLRADPSGSYAAHTAGRNSFAAGIAVCAMRDATPSDFGLFPLTLAQIDALCAVAARVARHYSIEITSVFTHAEAALEDGYFGANGAAERWDIARLAVSGAPLTADDAAITGDRLRARIRELC